MGAVIGAGWVARKYLLGPKRQKCELDEQERRIIDACLALAVAFRNEEKAGRQIDPAVSGALYGEALKPLCDELLEYQIKAASWPYLARKRLVDASRRLGFVTSFMLRESREHPNFTTGVVGAVLTQLLADDLPDFSGDEELVLDALRRSNNSLSDVSDEELAHYVQGLAPKQLPGLGNNLRGIVHELRYMRDENADGDEYVVEIFDATNHPGADVRIINTLTGEVREVQLKATNYRAYIEHHHERYADIPVIATAEVAARTGLESSGISYEELSGDVDHVVSSLGDVDDPGVLSSMAVTGMLTLARNVNILLKGQAITRDERNALVKDGARSALVSGLVHTVIG